MIVDLFIPCFIDQFYPETAFNVLKILQKAGVEVHYNPNQTCCGQPSFNSGYQDVSRDVARKFLNDFPENRPIVIPSGSCAGFIRNFYPELFKSTKDENHCSIVCKNVIELTDFLVNKLNFTHFNSVFKAKVTYHDACSALREYGIKDEPRKLLENVAGLELIEMSGNDVCCGFGGTFSVKHEPISVSMTQQKIESALQTGAQYIATTEASCLMSMNSYISKHKLPIKVIHVADILATGN